jgi:hypothetical protein
MILSGVGFSQCCSPGNPLGGYGNNGTLNSRVVKFYAQYKYSYSGIYKNGDKLYTGDTKDFRRSVQDGAYNFVGLGAAWGISERLTLESETGYFINKIQNHVQGVIPEQQRVYGFTDLSILVKPAFYKKREIEFTPAFGLKMPLGRYDQQYQNSILPADLQPTTGAVNYLAGFFLYKGFLKKHLRVFMIGRYEFPRTNPLEIKYGNAYIHSLFFSYSASMKISFALQIRSECRERDRAVYVGGGAFYSSGSNKLFIVPQLTYAFDPKWDVSLFSDLPVYQYYNGYQLGNTFAVAVMVSAKFNTQKVNSVD